MENNRVLITSPSIDPKNNVSGIANLTKLIIENNNEIEYELFVAGKKDSDKRGFKWLFSQISTLIEFYKKIKSCKYDYIHINMPLEKMAIIRDSSFAFITKILKQKFVIHIHGGFYINNFETPKLFKSLINRVLDSSNKIIVLGEKEKQFLHSYYKVDITKIFVLPNCVKVPEVKQKGKIERLNILYIGRLDINKGLREIVDALASLPNAFDLIFNIAGEGPDKDWFITLCEENLKNKYSYIGVVSGNSKEKLLSNSHIFLLPSYYEGLPNSLLEAMSYSNACIVTPVGSIPEVVRDNYNGLIVGLKNSEQIKDAIIRLVNEEGLYDRITTNAYNTIKENYSLDNYIVKLNRIYNITNKN